MANTIEVISNIEQAGKIRQQLARVDIRMQRQQDLADLDLAVKFDREQYALMDPLAGRRYVFVEPMVFHTLIRNRFERYSLRSTASHPTRLIDVVSLLDNNSGNTARYVWAYTSRLDQSDYLKLICDVVKGSGIEQTVTWRLNRPEPRTVDEIVQHERSTQAHG